MRVAPSVEMVGLVRRRFTYSLTEPESTLVSSSASTIEMGVSLLLPEVFGAGPASAT